MQIKQNLELKYSCIDFEGLRKVLKKLDAKKEIVKMQKDYFFNLSIQNTKKKGRMKMRIEGEKMTLIYYERPNFTRTQNATADVKILQGNKEMLNFLTQTLGVSTIVEKKREVWRKDNTVFHLDDIKGIGKVFEIELQKKGLLTESDKTLFDQYKKSVLPYLGKIIKGSNGDLLLKK